VFGRSSEIRAGLSIVNAIGSGAVPLVRRPQLDLLARQRLHVDRLRAERQLRSRSRGLDRPAPRATQRLHDLHEPRKRFPRRTGADMSIRFTP
jgi:hypothetical protein